MKVTKLLSILILIGVVFLAVGCQSNSSKQEHQRTDPPKSPGTYPLEYFYNAGYETQETADVVIEAEPMPTGRWDDPVVAGVVDPGYYTIPEYRMSQIYLYFWVR